MSLTAARSLTVTYFLLMLVFVTWPASLPFAKPTPLVLGLPFSLAWVAAWVTGSCFVLAMLDRVEKRFRDAETEGGEL